MAEGVDIVISAQDQASAILNSVSNKVSGFVGSLNPATIAMAAATAGAAAFAAGVAVVSSSVMSAANEIDALTDKAATLGESVGNLQAFAFALDVAGGISQEKTIASLQKLNSLVGDIATGGNDAGANVFARLSLDAERLATLSPVEQFKEIQNALSQIGNTAERAATAQELFGKSAAELLPALSLNSAELQAQEEYARSVNAAVSDEGAAAVGAMNDALGKVSLGFQGLFNTIAIQVAPAVESIANWLADWIPPIVQIVEDMAPALVDTFVYLNGIIKDTFNALSAIASFDTEGALAAINANSGDKAVDEMQKAREKAKADAAEAIAKQKADREAALTQRASDAADAAAEKQKAAVESTIASLERKLAVEMQGEDAVRRQEELAKATNDAERERIKLLQDQVAEQQKKNALEAERKKQAEEQAKMDEAARKKAAEEAQAKADALARPANVNVAVESRVMTRGRSDQAIDRVAKASELSNTLLEQIKTAIEQGGAGGSLQLEVVG